MYYLEEKMGTDNFFHKRKAERQKRVGSRGKTIDRFLIVCEGTETEPNYFNAFKELINTQKPKSVSIEIQGEGKNTVSLVERTIELKNRALPDYTQVWCVFDKDDFAQFDQAINLAEQHGICVAYSNESFELWYLLHFIYCDSALSRTQYIEKLEHILNIEYDKASTEMYEILEQQGDQVQAIKWAEKLVEQNQMENPSTTVYKLVNELNRFLPDV